MLDKIYATQPQTCAEFLEKIKIYTTGDVLAKRRNWTSSKIEKKAEMEKEKEGEGVAVKVIRHDTSNEVQKDSAWEQQFKKLQTSTQQMRVEMENSKIPPQREFRLTRIKPIRLSSSIIEIFTVQEEVITANS